MSTLQSLGHLEGDWPLDRDDEESVVYKRKFKDEGRQRVPTQVMSANILQPPRYGSMVYSR
jgi:hypothetical protein